MGTWRTLQSMKDFTCTRCHQRTCDFSPGEPRTRALQPGVEYSYRLGNSCRMCLKICHVYQQHFLNKCCYFWDKNFNNNMILDLIFVRYCAMACQFLSFYFLIYNILLSNVMTRALLTFQVTRRTDPIWRPLTYLLNLNEGEGRERRSYQYYRKDLNSNILLLF